MSYFNYHAKVKRLIIEGKLKCYYFDKEYKNIGFVLVLCFDDQKFPIREKRFEEYFEIIGKFYSINQIDDVCYVQWLFDK